MAVTEDNITVAPLQRINAQVYFVAILFRDDTVAWIRFLYLVNNDWRIPQRFYGIAHMQGCVNGVNPVMDRRHIFIVISY
jgi:hypothetical protein